MPYDRVFYNKVSTLPISLEEKCVLFGGIRPSTLYRWEQGYTLAPRAAHIIADALVLGWRPTNVWYKGMRLRDMLAALEQTPESFAEAMGIHWQSARRYVRDNGGPRPYIMIAAEAWLFGPGGPPPLLPELARKRVGRPPNPPRPGVVRRPMAELLDHTFHAECERLAAPRSWAEVPGADRAGIMRTARANLDRLALDGTVNGA